MGLMRGVLLRASQNLWLREQAPRYSFVRRTVERFMPGEELEDALAASSRLRADGISTIVTRLGENITTLDEGGEVAAHYLDALDRIHRLGLDTQISVKLTQLGLDQSAEVCFDRMRRIVQRAEELGDLVWIDMEGSAYTTATLDLFRRLRASHANVGVCLQAYLRRTAADLDSLLPIGPAVRLVKGAYNEPATIAFPRKRDVDANYMRLTHRLLGEEARSAGVRVGIATHDPGIIREAEALIASTQAPRSSYEFEMLYGIRQDEQTRLARAGQPVRVLISYGAYWYPWFMRRLAERPANMVFVLKNLFAH
jgi:proline dehydrogenase